MALSILKENCYLLIKLETKNVTKITCVIIPSGAMHLPALAWACTLGPPMVYLFFSTFIVHGNAVTHYARRELYFTHLVLCKGNLYQLH